MKRRCDKCGWALATARGHGFVTRDGKGIMCSLCTYPPKKKTGRRKNEEM